MKVPQIAAASAIVCLALWSSGALAETRRQERVTVTGCAYPGVTATCLMIKGPTGTVYNISAIAPRPRQSGRMIRVRGSITDKMSVCGEGVVLDRIRWTRTRQSCPN